MPYPSKTSPEAILEEAIIQLERSGANGFSVRAVAAALGLAPNAIYRYYTDREALIEAIAEEGTRQLSAELRYATGTKTGADAVRSFSEAYLDFARRRPVLYETVMTGQTFSQRSRPVYEDLWDFAAAMLRDVVGSDADAEATVSVWSLLHGAAGLEQAGRFSDKKPEGGIDFGLEALLKGMSHP